MDVFRRRVRSSVRATTAATLAAVFVCLATFAAQAQTTDPYPTRTTAQLKNLLLHPDPAWPVDWPYDDISGNAAGGVTYNMWWFHWQPGRGANGEIAPTAPCIPGTGEIEYSGYCFKIGETHLDNGIREYTNRGLRVTAILPGVPKWARLQACQNLDGCAPANPADFARFAAFLAWRYNGHNGNGRIVDFVIGNEVNAVEFFNIGCGNGTPCNATAWYDKYAAVYNAAYDAIKGQQQNAKVFFSFTGHFAVPDTPQAPPYRLSARGFILQLATRVAPRSWRVAWHPYPQDETLQTPYFSADDWPNITMGNVGAIVGWLKQMFPLVPSAGEVHLTEFGISSNTTVINYAGLPPSQPSSEGIQAQQVCNALINVVGTPGIENFVYQWHHDMPINLLFGLTPSPPVRRRGCRTPTRTSFRGSTGPSATVPKSPRSSASTAASRSCRS